MTSSTASHREPTVRWSRPEEEREGSHLLVMLHGLGADENDLFGIVPELPSKFTVASVRAPMALDYGGYTWFPVTQTLMADPLQVRASIEDLRAWVLDQAPKFSSVSLLGFSMGMSMATSLMRLDPTAYACTVGLSGFAIDPDAGLEPAQRGTGPLAGFFDDAAVAQAQPKMFWGRDQEDPVISPEKIEYTHAWVTQHMDLTKVLYAGIGHGIGPQELRHVGEYLDYMVR
ncbi:phospholipase [Micrococcus terreus]|uniref:alpha/beta hydrolase n=1 Tax=Micrococcus terreus TaxID=574650 RepID=UPI0033C499B3